MRLERVAETDAHEGPVFVASENALYFTSLPPRTAIKRLSLDTGEVSVVRGDANRANGMALAADGRLVVCEQSPGAIALVDPATGAREVLADSWRGRPLNSPNDVAVAPDGSIWFTDPSYGYLQGFRPLPELGDYVYRWDPRTRAAAVVADGFDKPNGIAFSPGGATLYVSDNGAPHHLLAFDVVGTHLWNRRLLAVSTPGHPDGLKTDADGRLYASSADGVEVYSAAGDPLGAIELPGAVNFCFGGPDRLFITADTAIWAVHLNPETPRSLAAWASHA